MQEVAVEVLVQELVLVEVAVEELDLLEQVMQQQELLTLEAVVVVQEIQQIQVVL